MPLPFFNPWLLWFLPLALLQYWRLGHEQRPDDDVATRIVDQFYS